MPKAYLLAEIDVHDEHLFKTEYLTRSSSAVAEAGGRFVVRGGEPELLEGAPVAQRVVLVEFESREQAKAFYTSARYQEAARWRTQAATARFLLVVGVA
jgi:uncharacterized protein (DUF1330 family)